jgi:iron(III) transport system substrate-binding protein
MRQYILFLIITMISFQTIQADELVVYTSRKEHLVKDIFELYTKKTGTKITYKTGKAPALIQTLKAEGKNTPADIFMTVDAGNLWHASSQDLLAPLSSSLLEKNIPTHLREKNNKWFGLSIRARTIAYNTNKVKADELKSYEDLADNKWNKRLCLRTSKKVYNQSLVAMLIHELGEKKAEEIVRGWVNNTVEIFSNDTAVLKAVASGQCDVGIVNTYYYGRLKNKEPKLPVKLFWPNQDSYGVHINISGAGVTKYSKKKQAAQKFLEWLAGPEAQKQFAQVNMENAILNSVEQAKEVKSWGKFKGNSTFQLSNAGVLQSKAIKLMRRANYK